jgi:hypothetical protein
MYAVPARRVRASYVPPWLLKLAGFGVAMLGKVLKRPVPLTPYRDAVHHALMALRLHGGAYWHPRVTIQ